MSERPQPEEEQPLEPQLEDVLDAVRASEGDPEDAKNVEADPSE